ncbi:MAG: TetR/AcrR family transcriptional regulator [Tannerellaceae bacterium]|jgi:AcrR family transcriptional regulator|nr:TetR/AcrR family transcriptional regulator [Tannerellaceae bacterium]
MKTDETGGVEGRIIEAARQVLVRKGYEATTMSDVAAEVGISRTAMHYYFRTKEMMFEAIFAQLVNSVLPNINLIMNENTTILEKLPAIVDQYVDALRHNLLFPLFVINEMNRDPEHLFHAITKNPAQIQPLVRLRRQILDEMESGLLRRMPLADVVSTFIGLFVFPILVRNTLTAVFMNGDSAAFDELLERRRGLTCEVMRRLLNPGDNRTA